MIFSLHTVKQVILADIFFLQLGFFSDREAMAVAILSLVQTNAVRLDLLVMKTVLMFLFF